MKNYISILFLTLLNFTIAQTLSLDQIMKGDGFIGNQPDNHRWSVDGSTLYFDWNPKNEIGNSTYYWKTGMKEPMLLEETAYDYSEINIPSQQEFENFF